VRTITKLLFLGFVIVFTACQKDKDSARSNTSGNTGGTGSTSTTNIEGDYDFVGMVAHTESSTTSNTMGTLIKAVTVMDYATKNNSGMMKITSNQLIDTNLGHSIGTTYNVKTYGDSVLVDDSNVALIRSTPPTSSTSTYERNSADSITVTGALGVVSDLFSTIAWTPPPYGTNSGISISFEQEKMGVKLSWSGDTLLLKVNSSSSQSVKVGPGAPATLVGSVNGIIRLKKH